MSNARQYGGFSVLERAVGKVHVRYRRRAGHREQLAAFTQDGKQVTEFSIGELIEKQDLLPWAKNKMEQYSGLIWKENEDGTETLVSE